ncbi:helix-turn-helix domain-containing protein [Kitasatospora griseola]|uniref:helix-turn-helix domain-containing protein n=1 Tax=Kitasatospora griseola TaxID=2064 RepID=UPI0038064D99
MADQLGTLLRRLRGQAGLTQEQAAERSGVSIRTIRRLERGGSTDHRLGTVHLLADALDIDEEDRRLLARLLSAPRTIPAPALEPEPAPEAGPGPGPEAGSDGMPAEGSSVPVPDPVPVPALAPVSPPVPAPVLVPDNLAGVVRELATEVRRRWQREEAQRQVHDPFPLPVRWRSAPGLMDRSENIQRLGPGEVPGRMDLDGDLRSVVEVYRRIPSGRLVVLGRAGSGKTVLAVRFLLDCLGSSAVAGRVPVVLGAGSWDPTRTALRDWLVDRLLREHPYLARRGPSGSTLAAALVDADLVLPVLDGFDEIAEGLRCEALRVLNATSLPLVVTSRRAEFAEAVREARAPLLWAAAVELADLVPDDLVHYLPRTVRAVTGGAGEGSRWDAVLAEVRAGRTPVAGRLAAVLATPLMVGLARAVYSESPDRDPDELLDAERFPTERAVEEHLLADFVPAVYRRRVPERDAAGGRLRSLEWEAGRAGHWLGRLAHYLDGLDHERQDLAWWRLGDLLPRSTRAAVVMASTALCVAVPDWLVGLCTGMGAAEVLLQGALMGSIAGLAFGVVYALLLALGGGAVFEPIRVRVRLPGGREGLGRRPVRTFAARFLYGLFGGFLMGVGCACATALERALYADAEPTRHQLVVGTLIDMLCLGLIFGTAAGLVFGLAAALEAPVNIASAATPADLLASNRATVARLSLVLAPALTLAIAFGGRLVAGSLQGLLGPLSWGLRDGLVIGTVGGIGGTAAYVLAFTAWGQWLVLSRIWLPLTGRLPWQPAAFLDDAYRRGVLRRTGAVYRFRHVRLQRHLGRAFRRTDARYTPAVFPSAAATWASSVRRADPQGPPAGGRPDSHGPAAGPPGVRSDGGTGSHLPM